MQTRRKKLVTMVDAVDAMYAFLPCGTLHHWFKWEDNISQKMSKYENLCGQVRDAPFDMSGGQEEGKNYLRDFFLNFILEQLVIQPT